MPKIYSKFKTSKTKKSFKLLVVLGELVYNIKIYLKNTLKAKVQSKGYLELKNIVIYTSYFKSGKNQGLVSVLNVF